MKKTGCTEHLYQQSICHIPNAQREYINKQQQILRETLAFMFLLSNFEDYYLPEFVNTGVKGT